MSTDRTKNKQVHQDRTLVEIKSSTGIKPLAGINFLAEEISDETLEAVAGGVVAYPARDTSVDQG